MFSIDSESFYSFDAFTNLGPGQYTLTIQDAIGCEWDTLISLVAPPELVVELGDNIEIALGDSVRLETFVNQAIDTFAWNLSGAFSDHNEWPGSFKAAFKSALVCAKTHCANKIPNIIRPVRTLLLKFMFLSD